MKQICAKIAMIAAVISAPSAAHAASPLELASDIFVERSKTNENGEKSIILEQPIKVLPGDRLVFIVNYKNVSEQTASDFSVTNPLPRAVRFAGTSDGGEIVSVDGGESWGELPRLKIKMASGAFRAAKMADVTHIKWTLKQSLAPGKGGKLVFRGVVK